MVEQAGVGSQVRARRAPDRLLVHLHQALYGVHIARQMTASRFDHRRPFVGGAFGRIVFRLVAQVQQHQLRQGLRDEAGLAGAGDTGDGRQHAQRNACIHAMQVVAVDALQFQPAGRFACPASRRGDLLEQIAGGARFGNLAQAIRLAAVEHAAATLSGIRPDIHQPLRAAHQVQVVLHHEYRVAGIAQPVERVV